ncbi:DUF2997 domain-containing protein [Pseudonocardia alaniniphila]|uniref:DUF2997 domain-containing protein n=1 Tax=Pseudonocardia alaniniphila TaxID=75291 RepID=A0ABS9T9G4_9PSEU|nr:DUF2997 domain-containing protein [Pseudonocardia alaniniphila]MCH6165181.1 DUF2997 domain-containing protein [Pseudonocardia alaniniphila]
MNPPAQIIVLIRPDGTVSAETKNVTGTACLDYIRLLEDLLGATTTDSSYTEDYTRSAATNIQEARNELGWS